MKVSTLGFCSLFSHTNPFYCYTFLFPRSTSVCIVYRAQFHLVDRWNSQANLLFFLHPCTCCTVCNHIIKHLLEMWFSLMHNCHLQHLITLDLFSILITLQKCDFFQSFKVKSSFQISVGVSSPCILDRKMRILKILT